MEEINMEAAGMTAAEAGEEAHLAEDTSTIPFLLKKQGFQFF